MHGFPFIFNYDNSASLVPFYRSMYAVILEWKFKKNRLIIDSSFKVHNVYSRSSNLCRRPYASVTASKKCVCVLQMCYQLEDLTGGAGDALQSVVAIKVY